MNQKLLHRVYIPLLCLVLLITASVSYAAPIPMALKNIPQGVGHDLDTPGATHTVVPSLEDGGDLILACHAKALCNEATEGISATQGTDTLVGLVQRDGHAACEEGRGAAIGQEVEGAREVEGFSAKALLEEEGGVAKETRGGAGAKGGESSPDCVR